MSNYCNEIYNHVADWRVWHAVVCWEVLCRQRETWDLLTDPGPQATCHRSPVNHPPTSQSQSTTHTHTHTHTRADGHARTASRGRGRVVTRISVDQPIASLWQCRWKGPGHQSSLQQTASHQTVHILFLANDRCLRDYDLVVEHCCWSLFWLGPTFMTWRYCMRDPYSDNNLIDYYTIIFNFVTHQLLHFSFYSLPSNDPQLSWPQASDQLNPAWSLITSVWLQCWWHRKQYFIYLIYYLHDKQAIVPLQGRSGSSRHTLLAAFCNKTMRYKLRSE